MELVSRSQLGLWKLPLFIKQKSSMHGRQTDYTDGFRNPYIYIKIKIVYKISNNNKAFNNNLSVNDSWL